MKKINVLFVSHGSGGGGAERCLLDIANELNKDIFNVYVNVPHQGQLAEDLKKNKITCFVSFTDRWIPPKKQWGLKHLFNFIKTARVRLWALESKIQKLDIHLVYSNSITCIDGALASYHMGIPHIWHIHENLPQNKSIKSYLPSRLTYLLAGKVGQHFIGVSSSVIKYLKNGVVVHNGIDIDTFLKQKKSLKAELSLSAESKIVAQIGTLMPAKGVDTFIDAAELFLKSHPQADVVFLLIGKGNEEFTGFLEEKIRRSSFSRNFILTGYRNDVSEVIHDIDLLILASESEGFSRTILEAMAAAKPVISTRCGGPEELIEDGQTGFLVPVNDSAAIAEKMELLFQSPELTKKMGESGSERAKQLFSFKRNIEAIEAEIIKYSGQEA